ncbi:hypothetical protein L861_15420 [Litchfieldella anticariensis FP35 = DSM 16096]|uniref:Phasin domain-containing protein n=1 Tax=Litchfieldella anticariensis (strain DSM 16096 / CECT 5854 / CIP 108499 / LMG 22089 / FP35) TaxID=1121939 RepID=S2L874_LITA3|nr:phasin family protein [Halomonas anticariensis]EPC00946.1 hypothetical protein L861_15420 [Halomonas anticariensis FP35 = DSM 16096]
MQDKMFDAFTEQTRNFFEPMRKLNGLMLDNMEKMTQYQLESMKRYSQLGTERVRDASEIKDAEDLRDFGTRQAAIMNELSKQMLEDARAMTELSMQFKSEMDKLFVETGQQTAEQTTAAAKAAKPEPATAASARATATKAESTKTATTKSEPAKATVKPEPAKAEETKPEPAKATPTKTSSQSTRKNS